MTIIFHWSGIDPSYETTEVFAGKGWLLVTSQGYLPVNLQLQARFCVIDICKGC